MRALSRLDWLLAGGSGLLLVLPFPIAGPLPHGRALFAWVALVPLLYVLLRRPYDATDKTVPHKFGFRRLVRNALLGYVCGIVWYAGTCYWIDATMRLYGNMPPAAAAGILVLFCLYLGLYHALFAVLVTLTQRAFHRVGWTLALAPFLWVAMELACARITSFPWNQLGDSQIDNLLLTRVAPWVGTYGISFVLMAGNCAIAAALLLRGWRKRLIPAAIAVVSIAALQRGFSMHRPEAPATASAMLLQPNLDVGKANNWFGTVFDLEMQHFAGLSEDACNGYFQGLASTGAKEVQPDCKSGHPPLNLIVWPESPAPFEDSDPRFRHWVSALAEDAHAPMIVGSIAVVPNVDSPRGRSVYNSASLVATDGAFVGRYDKMHLVPFGEYVPFKDLLSFAGSLTEEVGAMTHGTRRVVFATGGHRYGTFICYEAIFANEVRQFAKLGADVLVNISDDGWYGDTSAPWQHLNMARMRAIENDRWLLRDTNNGVTAAIDPYGRVVRSAPRHQQTSLLVHFNYVSKLTFYTLHGDMFAWLCAIIAIVLAIDGMVQSHPSEA